MKCQKCGAEIAEGKMYCPACGLEIQIVPYFEPEIEQTINQTMDHILNDVFQREDERPQTSCQQEKNLILQLLKAGKKNYYRLIVFLLIVSFMIIPGVYGYMNFTSDYQIRRGNYYLNMQDYENAIKHYEKAGILDPDNAEISLYLAECFEALGRMPGYEASLTEVIQNEEATQLQLNLAYTRLANLYLENEEYQKIDSLLKTCKDVKVIEMFGKYRAQLPQFSHESGEYSDIIPLKIQGGDKGTVYYTTDGSDPTAESKQYKSPIFLDKGEHTIKAIYVNEFGVVSEVISGKFTIKF